MAKIVTVKCNRCGEIITSNFSVLKFVAGEMYAQHDEDLDLCSSCSSEFLDWLKSSSKFGLSSSEATTTA
jgi:hypothetical protein